MCVLGDVGLGGAYEFNFALSVVFEAEGKGFHEPCCGFVKGEEGLMGAPAGCAFGRGEHDLERVAGGESDRVGERALGR